MIVPLKIYQRGDIETNDTNILELNGKQKYRLKIN